MVLCLRQRIIECHCLAEFYFKVYCIKKSTCWIIEKEKNISEKEGRVISYCFNAILATVILRCILRVYCEYQGCLGHFFVTFLLSLIAKHFYLHFAQMKKKPQVINFQREKIK